MADAFDPYYRWLAIPPREQPPHYYRLVGVTVFETDLDVIEQAADRQMAHVQRHQLGPHSAKSQKLLNELAAAKRCLLTQDTKTAYDRKLRSKLAAESPPVVKTPAAKQANSTPTEVAEQPVSDPTNIEQLGNLAAERGPSARRKQLARKKSSSAVPAFAALAVTACLAAGGGWYYLRDAPPTAASKGETSAVAANTKPADAEIKTPAPATEQPDAEVAKPVTEKPVATKAAGPVSAPETKAPEIAADPTEMPATTEEDSKPENISIAVVAPKAFPPPAQTSDQGSPPSKTAGEPDGSILLAQRNAAVSRVAISADGRRALSLDREGEKLSGVDYFDLETKRSVSSGFPFGAELEAATLTANGSQIIAGARDGAVYWLDPMIGADTRSVTWGFPIMALALSADDSYVAFGGPTGKVLGFEIKPGAINANLNLAAATSGPVTSLAFSPDGAYLLATAGGAWKDDQPAESEDSKLHLFDLKQGGVMALEGHTGSIWSAQFLPDGQSAVSASNDGTIRVWDLLKQKTTRRLNGHKGPVFSISVSKDGRWLVSGGADKTVRLWDLKTGKESRRFTGHTELVRSVAIAPDGDIAISGSNDHTVRLWNLRATRAATPRVAAAPSPLQKRNAVPDEAAQQETLKLVREVYADALKQAKKPAEKIALAEQLLADAAKGQSLVEQYLLYDEARSLAIAGTSPQLVVNVIQQLAARFDVDSDRLVAESLDRMNHETLPAPIRKDVADAVMRLAERAIEREDYDGAKRLMAVALSAARKANEKQLVTQITARGNELVALRHALETFQAAQKTLEATPDDAEANLVAGKYLCFVKQDWQAGLPHLAKASDSAIQEAARLELGKPTVPDEEAKIGDAWWAIAEAAKGKDKSLFHGRAAYWYSRSLPGIKGLAHTKIAGRLKELTAEPAKAAGPAPATAGDKPAGRPTNKSLAQRIKQAVKKDTLTRTRMGAEGRGVAFVDVSEIGLLVGFNYTLATQGDREDHITSIQPIYLGRKGPVNGPAFGTPIGDVHQVLAKKGYAVAGISAPMFTFIYGMEVTFNAIDGDSLNPRDSYNSEWLGGGLRYTRTNIGNNGLPIIGIFGTQNDYIGGLGFVQLPKQ